MPHKKLLIGADPMGFELKNAIKQHLIDNGYHVDDITEQGAIHYSNVGDTVGQKISQGDYQTGIIFCGTGMGVSISANKHPHVYAGVCESITTARLCRSINNCNVLAFGGLLLTPFKAKQMVDAYLNAQFSHGFSEAKPEDLKSGFECVQKLEQQARS